MQIYLKHFKYKPGYTAIIIGHSVTTLGFNKSRLAADPNSQHYRFTVSHMRGLFSNTKLWPRKMHSVIA